MGDEVPDEAAAIGLVDDDHFMAHELELGQFHCIQAMDQQYFFGATLHYFLTSGSAMSSAPATVTVWLAGVKLVLPRVGLTV